jgi:acetyl esterase/lipase
MPAGAFSGKLRMLNAIARQHHYDADVLPQYLCCEQRNLQGKPVFHLGRAVLALRVNEEDVPVDLWRSLLGEQAGGPDVSPYAAPARATDLARLAPTLMMVAALDLLLEEDPDYARRLARAFRWRSRSIPAHPTPFPVSPTPQ